jgi:hypothetical protein
LQPYCGLQPSPVTHKSTGAPRIAPEEPREQSAHGDPVQNFVSQLADSQR